MSNWYDIGLEIDLRIPKKDFPLKGDIIVGTKYPQFIFPEDEGSEKAYPLEGDENDIVLKGEYSGHLNYGQVYDEDVIEYLKELCKKYKGTMRAESTDEEHNTDVVVVKNGKAKKIQITETEVDE